MSERAGDAQTDVEKATEKGRGLGISKAVLLAAAARAAGIPARLGFAYHGFTELWLEGRWIKVTPTFNRSLCERFGVKTRDFEREAEEDAARRS
ncbi:MAG: transglutaminase domain-containing protein [Steroidobacteraceae bacterium]